MTPTFGHTSNKECTIREYLQFTTVLWCAFLLITFFRKAEDVSIREESNLRVPKSWGYFHNFLVMLSGLFLVAISTATIAILHFSPDNEYIPMELELTTRLDVLVYSLAALILLGTSWTGHPNRSFITLPWQQGTKVHLFQYVAW